MYQFKARIAQIICIGGLLIGFTGCDDTAPTKQFLARDQAGGGTPEQVQSVEILYGAILHQGEKLGHMMEKIEHLNHQDQAFVRTTSTENIRVQRAGRPMEMQAEHVFLETDRGELRQFVSKINQAGAITRFQGQVSADGRTLTITTQSSAARQPVSETLAWQPEFGGLHAVRQLFAEPPLKAGETRSTTAFSPTLNRAAKITVQGLEKEAATLLDGASYELLKASYITEIAGEAPLEATVWLDDSGDVQRMTSPVQDFQIYRCPKEVALSENKAVSFDLAVDTVVQIRGEMPDRASADSAAYRLTLQASEPERIFSSQTNQRLEPAEGRSAILRVFRVHADERLPDELPLGEKPRPEDSAPSPLIQADDPLVRQLASQATIPGDDRWQQAVALEKFVHQVIQQKDFSRGFLSAADVAQQKVGDCTEHAVLLIALLRAHGIPARGALGLVYVDETSQAQKAGFAYHMWTEAWIGDRWIPLDATRGEGGIDVGYIKVTQSSLSGSGAFAAFLPVSQVIGQLEIEVVE